MEAKRKHYEAPSTTSMEIAYDGIICASTQSHIIWLMDGDDFSSGQGWARDGYGDAEGF